MKQTEYVNLVVHDLNTQRQEDDELRASLCYMARSSLSLKGCWREQRDSKSIKDFQILF